MDIHRTAAPLRVLHLADDSPDTARLRETLGRAAPPIGLEVVGTAAQAALRLQDEPGGYTWVLCDLTRPGDDALRVLEQVRVLPLVALALVDRGDAESAARALRAGASGCIVRHGDLLPHLPRLLHQARERALAQAAQPLRVLHVEDGSQDSGPLCRYVAAHAPQLRLQTVRSGMPGLPERLASGLVDLLLLDLPPDGRDLAHWLLLAQQAQGLGLPVVALAAAPSPWGGECVVKEPGYLRGLPALLQAVHARSLLAQEMEHLRRSEWQARQPAQQAPESPRVTFEPGMPDAVPPYGHGLDGGAAHGDARAEFLSRMSHELRTPLNAVLGFAQLIQADDNPPLSQVQRRHLDRIEQAGQHLVGMIDTALGLVRQPGQAPAPGGTAATGAVLYAEDDAINVEVMRAIIAARTRLRLEVARSGAEAIRMARQRPPDLLLLDIHLGDMDGIAVSDALRADPRLRDVPRIALSADASPGQVRRARERGFVDYLTKPVDVAALTACLGRHLPPSPAA